MGAFNPDNSTFTVVDDKPMPPGKYKVSIQLIKKHKDSLKGKLGPASTPFVFDIQTGKEEINVDLEKAAAVPEPKPDAKNTPTQRSRRRG